MMTRRRQMPQAARPPGTARAARANHPSRRSGPSLARLPLSFHQLVMLRLELAARFPPRWRVSLADAIPDRQKYFQIFTRAAQIPVRFYDIRWLVVVALDPRLLDLRGVLFRLSDKRDTFLQVERWHALFGEIEMVRSVVRAHLGLRIGPHDSSLLARGITGIVIELGCAVADDGQIVRPTVHVQSVQIDCRHRLRERIDRPAGVVLRAEKALFLGRHGQKEDR